MEEQEKRPPKLLDQLRELLRIKHYSYKTEQSYVQWVKRYILFHNKRHPKDMGEQEITQFLSHLAVKENVSASLVGTLSSSDNIPIDLLKKLV